MIRPTSNVCLGNSFLTVLFLQTFRRLFVNYEDSLQGIILKVQCVYTVISEADPGVVYSMSNHPSPPPHPPFLRRSTKNTCIRNTIKIVDACVGIYLVGKIFAFIYLFFSPLGTVHFLRGRGAGGIF